MPVRRPRPSGSLPLDVYTLRASAELARVRAVRTGRREDMDGMERLGARKALEQFAKDLDATADQESPQSALGSSLYPGSPGNKKPRQGDPSEA